MGGFFHLGRAKLALASTEMKKANRCCAADGFLSLLVGYKGTSEGFFRAERGKSPLPLNILEDKYHLYSALTITLKN